MVNIGKFRNEDLSMYCWLRELLKGKVKRVMDAYPYTDLEEQKLEVPSASIEHRLTEEFQSELGSSWFRRMWAIDIFATNDKQRDELADIVFQALNDAIPIKDFSGGYYILSDCCKKNAIGADLEIIESVIPEQRTMQPSYAWGEPTMKYWHMVITYETASTSVNTP